LHTIVADNVHDVLFNVATVVADTAHDVLLYCYYYCFDCTAGDAKGDDESVVVNLQDLSSDVDALIFTVHAFSGMLLPL
jgi:hypothetical protein